MRAKSVVRYLICALCLAKRRENSTKNMETAKEEFSNAYGRDNIRIAAVKDFICGLLRRFYIH